jgi:excisionase family DNA binding protein
MAEHGKHGPNDLLSVREAREYLGVSEPKMWRLIRDGVITTQRDPLDKRKRLVKRGDLDALVAQSQTSKSAA